MPYWDELSYNLEGLSSGAISRFPMLRSACYQRTFRSRGGRGKVLNVPVSDSVAEPFLFFDPINDLKKREYTRRFGNDGAIRRDVGHTWEFRSFERTGPFISFSTKNKYTGSVIQYSNVSLSGALSPNYIPDLPGDTLSSYAQQQYSKAAPRAEIFNLSQFLGELREGLPGLTLLTKSVFKASIGNAVKATSKNVGKNYVGYQFGIAPLVSDLQKFGQSLMAATAQLTGFCEPIHRRREMVLPLVAQATSDSRSVGINWAPSLSQQALGPQFIPQITREGSFTSGSGMFPVAAEVLTSRNVNQKMWYEAEYVLVPKIGFDPSSYIDRLETLMNTDFTISTLWELAPWSWLLDWAVKIGDSISSNELATSNRVVTNYAYAMCETEVVESYVARNMRINSANSSTLTYNGPSTYAHSHRLVSKRRIRANPFGFNPVTSSITQSGQWAILGALAAAKQR